jgi:hypothetical protein
MSHPQVILQVKFKSALPVDKAMEIARDRMDDFRALKGLKQKYYLYDAATEEICGLYLWDSPEALDEYRQSELRATIAAAYQATGEPQVQVFKVLEPLRDQML